MNNIIKRVWNQNRMVNIEDLSGMAFQAEDGGHTFEISGVNDAGETVELSGTVSGVFMRPDLADIAIVGSATDGVVSVTLPADCYAVNGRFALTIFVTSDSQKVAVYAAVGTVTRTSGGAVAGDTPQDVVDLINDINAAIASIPADYTDLMAAIAPTYSDQSVYPVGAYRWYDGVLYKSKVAITTAESFTAAHWETVALADDVSKLQNALALFEYQTETISGKIFRITDSISKVSVDHNVTLGNRNIMPNNINRTESNPITANGLTYYVQSDGSLRVYGTATANTSIWINNLVMGIPAGKYTLSGCPSGGSASTYRLICNYRTGQTDHTWLIDYGSGCTEDLPVDADYIRCAFYVYNGATLDVTVYPQLEYSENASSYIKADNRVLSSGELITIEDTITLFSNDSFNITEYSEYKAYIAGLISDLSSDVRQCESDISEISDYVSAMESNRFQKFNINDYSLMCIHHDNFSRTMTGWEIGMNAGGTDTGNSYEWVTSESYDDGLRVNEGATFEANSSRTNNFSLRKIATDHADNFVIETNAPTTNNHVSFGYNVTNVNNFTLLSALKQTNGYRVVAQKITNNTFGDVIMDVSVYAVLAKVLTFCFDNQRIYVFADDQLIISKYIGEVGSELYLAAYKGSTVHYDFINVFNIRNHIEWNPNHVLDTGNSSVPLIVTSANDGGYSLQATNTRWSDYADKFVLHSTDPLIHNGRRAERSVANVSDYTGNLRHLNISFDAYFPSTSADTEQNDIMMQMHDRDGTYRGFVPFILNYDNNKIKITLASTHAPKDGADDVLKWVEGAEIESITTDEWHRFEMQIKERYDSDQNPFVRIYIDSKLVFESRKPNCFNDLLGSSPQYGIYKNLWGTDVTVFERYFDNFKVIY